MKDDSHLAVETEQQLEQGDSPFPEYIEISREQRDRLFIDGYPVVSNGRIMMLQHSVVAFKPFPKSKSSFTIEVQFEDRPMEKNYKMERKPNYSTATVRLTFINYVGMVAPPLHLANYRGNRVMGIFHSRMIHHSPGIRSLDYTLFFAPKNTPKH